jgi:hypothetical protein
MTENTIKNAQKNVHHAQISGHFDNACTYPEDPGQSDDAKPVALSVVELSASRTIPGLSHYSCPLFLIFLFYRKFTQVASLKHFSRVPKCF